MEKIVSSESSVHVIFKRNPLELKNMVNKVVKVHYNYGCIEGTVYTIDPVSQMIALMVKDENTGNVDMHLIFEKHVKSVEIIGPSPFMVTNDLFNKTCVDLTPKEKLKRCDKLLKWLQSNMIPIVKEGDILKLADVLTIHPPYEPDNCISKNVIILEKIQNLILTMK